MKIEHIGIAVRSLDEAIAAYRDGLGLKVAGFEESVEDGVRIAMLPIGESRIELLEATDAASPVARFLEKRGPGIHHIAVRVEDIDEALGRLRASGARLIDDAPRAGAGGTRVAFVHPDSTHGVLLELVEDGK